MTQPLQAVSRSSTRKLVSTPRGLSRTIRPPSASTRSETTFGEDRRVDATGDLAQLIQRPGRLGHSVVQLRAELTRCPCCLLP